MRRSTAFAFVAAVATIALGGCSSTLFYEATGAYAVDTDDSVRQFDSEASCQASGAGSCTKIVMAWRTERYCGIYQSSPYAVTEYQLRVASNPATYEGWTTRDDATVFLGDDEQYVLLADDAEDDGTDLLCGNFVPPTNLVDVTSDQTINLQIHCKPRLRGLKLMPATALPYPLTVAAVDEKKTWLGCKR